MALASASVTCDKRFSEGRDVGGGDTLEDDSELGDGSEDALREVVEESEPGSSECSSELDLALDDEGWLELEAPWSM